MSKYPKEFKEWLEGLEHHTFTVFESESELEDKLYLAYYEELKALMIAAAKSCKQSRHGNLALSIENSVEKN